MFENNVGSPSIIWNQLGTCILKEYSREMPQMHDEGAQQSKEKPLLVVSSSRNWIKILTWFEELLDMENEHGQGVISSNPVAKLKFMSSSKSHQHC